MLTYSFENIGKESIYEYLYKCIKKDIIEGRLVKGEHCLLYTSDAADE